MDIHAKLRELGLQLPGAPKPVAAYVPCVRSGDHLFVSGQLPMREGKLIAVGSVPSQVKVEEAQAAARQGALNALAIVHEAIGGDWTRFVRVARVVVYVCSDASFTEQPKVANGASELLGAVLGEAGRHARSAVGVSALPLGAAVEVEVTVEVRG